MNTCGDLAHGLIKIRGSGGGSKSQYTCVFGCASGAAAGHKPCFIFYYSIIIVMRGAQTGEVRTTIRNLYSAHRCTHAKSHSFCIFACKTPMNAPWINSLLEPLRKKNSY